MKRRKKKNEKKQKAKQKVQRRRRGEKVTNAMIADEIAQNRENMTLTVEMGYDELVFEER